MIDFIFLCFYALNVQNFVTDYTVTFFFSHLIRLLKITVIKHRLVSHKILIASQNFRTIIFWIVVMRGLVECVAFFLRTAITIQESITIFFHVNALHIYYPFSLSVSKLYHTFWDMSIVISPIYRTFLNFLISWN